MLGWFYAFGGDITISEGKGYQFNTQEVEDALTFLRDMYDDGCAWLSESQLPETEFANRQGLFATGSVVGIPFQEAAFANAESSDKWTVIPFPSSKGETAIDVYGPSFQVLTSEAENQLASWLFIKWLTSPENQAELSQASGFYPVRATSLEHLDILPRTYPQWAEAVDLLSLARSEPAFPSWRVVRWAVSDAATQLYRYYFTIDQIPSLVRLLDRTANDLHSEDK
jgi:ABC-type glycerol-3-phosphate transport system substrate-binding protein